MATAKYGLNFSFSGCGFLGMYHLGAVARLKEGQKLHKDDFVIKSALGASAGALAATALVLDLPTNELKQKMLEIASQVNSMGFLGPFHPNFDVVDLFQHELIKILPSEAHLKATGKLHISITDSTMNNVIVSNFSSIEELKDALICSCYLPGFSSWKQVPTYNGKPYIDGGFSNNQPVFDELSSIRISPFAGGSHICPNDGPEDGSGTRPFISKWGGEVVNLTGTNMKRFYEALMPPEDLNIFYQQGYQHTNTFLESSKFKQFLKNVPLSDIDNNNNENHT